MKTSFVLGARHARAFTLMELLVVVTIIALLGSLAASQYVKALDQANRTKTLALAMELKTGISGYVTDYQRFPLDASPSSSADAPEILTDGSNRLVDALLGVPMESAGPGSHDLNPKRIPFASFTPAKYDRHGIVGTAIPRRFHDMWGQPFRILLDTNGDNQVMNPDLRSSDAKIAQNQSKYLAVQVAVYSSGKDGIPNTADDVATWRSR